MMRRAMIEKGIQDALPIMLANFPVAVTFGVIATSNGIPWSIAFLISAWVYAGGTQFMLVSLTLAGTSLISTIAMVLLVNLRLFMFGTILGPACSKWPEAKKWISAFGLTDEVFAVTSSRSVQEPLTPAYQMPFVFSCYGSWLAGTAVGASIGQAVPTTLSTIIGFAVPALFLALLMIGKRSGPYFIAAFFGAGLSLVASLLHLSSLGIVIGAVVGASLGVFFAEQISYRKSTTIREVFDMKK